MSRPRRPRVLLAAVAVAASALLLSACSSSGGIEPGAAALVGDARITESQLTTQVQNVLAAKGQPITSPDLSLQQQTLGRMITSEVVDVLALRNGVVITPGQIDEQMANYEAQAGSQEQMEQVFAEQNVAPSQIEGLIRLQLQAQQLGIKIDPHGSAEEQGQAVFDAAAKLSAELDTTVSPRYGTWDAKTLAVGGVPNDLAVPPAAAG